MSGEVGAGAETAAGAEIAAGAHGGASAAEDPAIGLRALLNEWDFLGVADVVDDEYDCMVAPVLALLRDGAGRAEIGAFLIAELTDHFGLSRNGRDTDEIAGQVVAWWSDLRASGDGAPA